MSALRVLTSPDALELSADEHAVFLAGSIEQGAAVDWQASVLSALENAKITALNPRRAQWDASWPQSATDPRFRGQVEWELAALERANTILLYLDPATKAPVSLLELGLFARSDKLVVCCPEGFWRKGNVDIVCERYGVERAPTLDALVRALERRLRV